MTTGVFKQLRFKKETTWATLAGAAGAQILRRKTSTLDEVRATYGSAEINPTMKRASFVHGTRTCQGSINDEISGGTFQQFFESLLRRLSTAIGPISSLTLTMAGAGPTYTITRSAGSFLADGFKVGSVWRITAGAVNADTTNKNCFVVAVTALVLTVIPWGGTLDAQGRPILTAEGPIATCTMTAPGKLTFVPSAGQTNDSYTMEHWFADLGSGASEVFAGCRINTADVSLPPTGLSEVTFGVLGRGFGQAPSGSAYFTAPTAATTSMGVSAVNGIVRAAGVTLANLTGLTFKVNGNMTTGQVVGSNYTPDVYAGPIDVTGQLTAYFADTTLRDAFFNESLIGLNFVAYVGTAKNADFVCFTMPQCKLGSATKSDGPGPISVTAAFTALDYPAGGAGTDSEQTNIWMQDSLAV